MAFVASVLLVVTLAIRSSQAPLGTGKVPLRAGLLPSERVTVDMNQTNLAQALIMYSELTGRTQLPRTSSISQQIDEFLGGRLSRWHIVKRPPQIQSAIEYHRDGLFTVGEVKEQVEKLFSANGFVLVPHGNKHFRVIRPSKP